jgi:hypothetical protein
MSTIKDNDESKNLDIWKDLESDSAEVKLKKKRERWLARKNAATLAACVFGGGGFLALFINLFPVNNKEAEAGNLKPIVYAFFSFAIVCTVYSLDYLTSPEFKKGINERMEIMNSPPFVGPSIFLFCLCLSVMYFAQYYYMHDPIMFVMFKICIGLSLFMFWISYDGLERIFS